MGPCAAAMVVIHFIIAPQLVFANCREKDYAFVDANNCAEGLLGIGENCSCDDSICRFSSTRKFLPPPNDFFKVLSRRSCNDHLSRYLDWSIVSKGIFHIHNGYPQDRNCTEFQCHQPSFGKYLRYTSLMQYFRFRDSESKSTPSLYDLDFAGNFRWTRGIADCGSGDHLEWKCIFKDMSESVAKLSPVVLPHEFDLLRKFGIDFLDFRVKKKDHLVQMMIYGKLLALMTRPSNLMISYMNQHIVSSHEEYHSHMESLGFYEDLNNDVRFSEESGNYSTDSTIGTIPEPCSMNSQESHMSQRMRARICRVPSVAMHVRQGDSCDIILEAADDNMTSYLQGDTKLRPCFSVDVYMKQLYLLRMIYGAHRVYLATDSEEMIQRTHLHKEYHWVYINISRSFLDKRHGWIDDRKDNDNENILFSAVADFLLMRRGDIFLGSFSSHFSKLAYYSIAGTRMTVPPFISLDYPLGCDTVDSCSDLEVLSRSLTVEEVISRAPECQRADASRGITGFVTESEDPCGIYTSNRRN